MLYCIHVNNNRFELNTIIALQCRTKMLIRSTHLDQTHTTAHIYSPYCLSGPLFVTFVNESQEAI